MPPLLKAALEAQAEGKFLVADSGNFKSAGFISRAPAEAYSIGYEEEMSATLRSGLIPDVVQAEILDMTHANDVIRECGDTSPTLQARMGTGGNQIPLVFEPKSTGFCPNNSSTATSLSEIDEKSPTLSVTKNIGVCYAIGNGQAAQTDLRSLAGTLNCMHDQQAVIYAIDRAAFNQGENAKYDFQIDDSGINSTIVARGASAVLDCRLSVWIVRRLTPRECERLQGFPDDWTMYDTNGNELKDTPRYKALGNSIAIPCAVRVFQGIVEAENTRFNNQPQEEQKCLETISETA